MCAAVVYSSTRCWQTPLKCSLLAPPVPLHCHTCLAAAHAFRYTRSLAAPSSAPPRPLHALTLLPLRPRRCSSCRSPHAAAAAAGALAMPGPAPAAPLLRPPGCPSARPSRLRRFSSASSSGHTNLALCLGSSSASSSSSSSSSSVGNKRWRAGRGSPARGAAAAGPQAVALPRATRWVAAAGMRLGCQNREGQGQETTS